MPYGGAAFFVGFVENFGYAKDRDCNSHIAHLPISRRFLRANPPALKILFFTNQVEPFRPCSAVYGKGVSYRDGYSFPPRAHGVKNKHENSSSKRKNVKFADFVCWTVTHDARCVFCGNSILFF